MGSISSTFNKQLLHTQITKAPNRQLSQAAFALSGSARVKALRKNLMKLTPGRVTDIKRQPNPKCIHVLLKLVDPNVVIMQSKRNKYLN